MANDKPANKSVGDNESKFLAAIEKFAQQQRDALQSETKDFEQRVCGRQKKKVCVTHITLFIKSRTQ